MAKQINFTFNKTDYTLEFTRKSIEVMERQGFLISDIAEKPMLMLPALFQGAFLAHHRHERKDVVDNIFKAIGNKEELFAALVEMYNEPINALMDEPEESEGKLEWGKGW